MDLSFILSDICISWILLHTPFHINCLLFLFSYDFIFRWMQINAKCSFKYALVFYPAPPPHIEGGNFQWASDHVCSLGLDPSSPATGALPFSSSSQRLALCTTLQRGFDVARLEKDAVPFDEMRLACSQSMCVDLQNTGVHSNQCWREKILQCKSEEVCIILIGAKERWVTYQPENLKEKTFELDCFPTVLGTADRHLQRGHTGSRGKSMASACHSLISPLTRTHLERFSHFSHTLSDISVSFHP